MSDAEAGDAPAAMQEQTAPQVEHPAAASTPKAETPSKPTRKKAKSPSKPARKKARTLSKPQKVLSPKKREAKGRKGIEGFIDNWLWDNRRQAPPESKKQAVDILLNEAKEYKLREDLLNMAACGDKAAEAVEKTIYEFLDFIDMSQSRGVDGAYEFDKNSIINAAEVAIGNNLGKLIDIAFDDDFSPKNNSESNVENRQKKRSGSYRWHDSPSEQDISGDEVASEQVGLFAPARVCPLEWWYILG